MPFAAALIIWCFVGIIFFFKTFDDVKKPFKLFILFILCGPAVWVISIIGLIAHLIFIDIPNWFKS